MSNRMVFIVYVLFLLHNFKIKTHVKNFTNLTNKMSIRYAFRPRNDMATTQVLDILYERYLFKHKLSFYLNLIKTYFCKLKKKLPTHFYFILTS